MHSLKRQSIREVCKQVTDMRIKQRHRVFFVWVGFFSLAFLGASGITRKNQGRLWDIWCFLQVSITESSANFNKLLKSVQRLPRKNYMGKKVRNTALLVYFLHTGIQIDQGLGKNSEHLINSAASCDIPNLKMIHPGYRQNLPPNGKTYQEPSKFLNTKTSFSL